MILDGDPVARGTEAKGTHSTRDRQSGVFLARRNRRKPAVSASCIGICE
jgi:hypothetical protein